jgi:hypothetical protein
VYNKLLAETVRHEFNELFGMTLFKYLKKSYKNVNNRIPVMEFFSHAMKK